MQYNMYALQQNGTDQKHPPALSAPSLCRSRRMTRVAQDGLASTVRPYRPRCACCGLAQSE